MSQKALLRSIGNAARPRPLVYGPGTLPRGTYVIATKWSDGDPGDGYAVGFYYGANIGVGEDRHVVVDEEGYTFRHNGFRRVQRISAARGTWIVQHMTLIERLMNRFSVWHWVRLPWRDLHEIDRLGLAA